MNSFNIHNFSGIYNKYCLSGQNLPQNTKLKEASEFRRDLEIVEGRIRLRYN